MQVWTIERLQAEIDDRVRFAARKRRGRCN